MKRNVKRTENGRTRLNATARPSRISPSDRNINSDVAWILRQYSEVVRPNQLKLALSQGGAVAGGVEKARALIYDRRATAFLKLHRGEPEISRMVFMVFRGVVMIMRTCEGGRKRPSTRAG